MGITEQNWLQKLQDPRYKRTAFEQLVKTYSEPLYWQIRRMVLSHQDANDILQDTFLKAWSSIDQFLGNAKISTWLFRIAVNESLNFLNRQKRMLPMGESEELLLNNLEADEYFDGDKGELQLQKAILTLPEKQRLIFNMRYFEEMKFKKMAEILETSEGALRASYHIAVKKIENVLKEDV